MILFHPNFFFSYFISSHYFLLTLHQSFLSSLTLLTARCHRWPPPAIASHKFLLPGTADYHHLPLPAGIDCRRQWPSSLSIAIHRHHLPPSSAVGHHCLPPYPVAGLYCLPPFATTIYHRLVMPAVSPSAAAICRHIYVKTNFLSCRTKQSLI